MPSLGKAMILTGLALIALGLFVVYGPRLPFRLGRLPGDLVMEGDRGGFYFPIVTCLLLSGLLSALAWIFRRLWP
jgi:hypothetical protein